MWMTSKRGEFKQDQNLLDETVQEGANDEGQNHTATEDHHLLLDNIRYIEREKYRGERRKTQ